MFVVLLAWTHLKTDIAKGPIQLANAQIIANRLNQADQSKGDLDPREFYATAGSVKDGVVKRIQTQMSEKFPNVPSPELDAPAEGAVAYAYMQAQLKFKIPFFDNDDEFRFTEANGRQVSVKSFGIRKRDDYAYRQLREQVGVLYCPEDVFRRGKEGGEFVIDPCKYSQPYQIILASIRRKPTLAEAVADVDNKIKKTPITDHVARCGPRDTLLIPAMHWRISHHFKELEGKDKQLSNPTLAGLFLDSALQTIQFRLDRSGASLSSESKVYVKPGASYFNFGRPFLVIMKKRDGKHPFFVMWVDNAELLDK